MVTVIIIYILIYSVMNIGFGLSSTVAELSTRTDVFSKSEDDNSWRHSFYEYDWLREHNLVIPEETDKQPTVLDLPTTGTVVQLNVKPSKKLQLKVNTLLQVLVILMYWVELYQ